MVGQVTHDFGNAHFSINQHTNGSRALGWEACPHTAVLNNGNLVVGWVGNGASGKGIYLTLLKRLADAPLPEAR